MTRPHIKSVLYVIGISLALYCIVWFSNLCRAKGLEGDYGESVNLESARSQAFRPRAPQWSPDGRNIIFSHNGKVYVVDPNGHRLRTIGDVDDDPNLAYAPSVSPDGLRIAYSEYQRSGRFLRQTRESWEIVVSSLDGSLKRTLTSDNRHDLYPAWLPDGSGLVYRSEIWGIDKLILDNSRAEPVIQGGDVRWSAISTPPRLSPDGSRVAFVASRYIEGEAARQLYVVDMDGSDLTLIDTHTSVPAWSPSGQRIAYATADDRLSEDFSRLLVADVDGSGKEVIASLRSRDIPVRSSLSWSPDGTALLIGTFMVRADGSITVVPIGRGNHAAWAPDSKRIAVYVHDDSDVLLYSTTLDSSKQNILVKTRDDGQPVAAGVK